MAARLPALLRTLGAGFLRPRGLKPLIFRASSCSLVRPFASKPDEQPADPSTILKDIDPGSAALHVAEKNDIKDPVLLCNTAVSGSGEASSSDSVQSELSLLPRITPVATRRCKNGRCLKHDFPAGDCVARGRPGVMLARWGCADTVMSRYWTRTSLAVQCWKGNYGQVYYARARHPGYLRGWLSATSTSLEPALYRRAPPSPSSRSRASCRRRR